MLDSQTDDPLASQETLEDFGDYLSKLDGDETEKKRCIDLLVRRSVDAVHGDKDDELKTNEAVSFVDQMLEPDPENIAELPAEVKPDKRRRNDHVRTDTLGQNKKKSSD